MTRPPSSRASVLRAFSLIELVIVVVIIGIIAAIAAPRFGTAADRSRVNAVAADEAGLQKAVELYAAEHGGRGPEIEPDGSLTTDPRRIAVRLLRPTLFDGTVSASGTLGPYLQDWPVNPMNGDVRLRLDGVAAGAGTAGWRYSSASRSIQADTLTVVTTAGATSNGKAWLGAELPAAEAAQGPASDDTP